MKFVGIKKKFEDIVGELDLILRGKRGFWNLEAICHVSYEDVCQIIRLHVYSQFDQWNQELPFHPWAARLINNQISNLKEQYYGKFAPPCRKCDDDLGSNLCGRTESGIKCSECPFFAKWEQKKEAAYRVILAESADKAYYEDEDGEGRIKIEAAQSPDYFLASSRLHQMVMNGLNDKMKKVYRLLYIENRSDDYVAKEMGFKTNEKGKRPGYRSIWGMKREIVARAKEIMKETDIFTDS